MAALLKTDRLFALLDLFTMDRPDWSVEEAAERLDLATSTAYRYFNSLSASGLLTRYDRGRYGLGSAIIRYDRQLRLTDPFVLASRGELDRIARVVAGDGVAFLCRLFGDQVMCIAQSAVGNPAFALSYERGRLMPLFAGSASLIVLANLTPRQLTALHRRERTAFANAGLGEDLPAVRQTLRDLREAGSCIRTGEVDRGMRGISVPVRGGGGVLGSLSVAGPRAAMGTAITDRLVGELRDSAAAIERELQRIETSRAPNH